MRLIALVFAYGLSFTDMGLTDLAWRLIVLAIIAVLFSRVARAVVDMAGQKGSSNAR